MVEIGFIDQTNFLEKKRKKKRITNKIVALPCTVSRFVFKKMSLTVEDFQLLQAQINKLKEENYEVKEREQKLKKGIFHNFLSSCSVFILPMFLLYLF